MTSILFWTLATLLTAAALYSLLRPLLRRVEQDDTTRETSLIEIYRERLQQLEQQHQRGELDSDQLTAARAELEASLALELPEHKPADTAPSSPNRRKVVPVLVGLGLPLAAALLYLSLGMPAAIDGGQRAADGTSLSIEDMVARLEQRLQTNPEDARGWIMLGRTYTALRQLDKARDAYLEAVQRAPANAEVLFHLTEVSAALQNNTLIGEPETYLNLGLQLEPQSRQGRWLLGILAFQQGNSEKAVGLWEQLLAESGNAEEQEMLESFIQEAKSMATEDGLAQAPTSTPASTPAATEEPTVSTATAASGPRVSVNVRLSDRLAKQVSDSDTLFVYARAASGPPMPLAIVRTTAGELPLNVSLDDSQA
ncbi:MAG TPA: c-type cytochrome biogenesis protein CcmI, partial [Gammaproteobacteria bacterium]